MKNLRSILLIALAAITMAACSRVQSNHPENSEILFQVAGYRTRDAATKAPEDYKDQYGSVPFGAYSWFKGENPVDNTSFMTNQKVSYNATDNIWFTEGHTYYWPKGGSLDFICYSPYSTEGNPSVEENTITYTSWDVAANPGVDLQYSDKAIGQKENVNTYYYSGVPVLFRHALAKIGFTMRLAYSEMTPETGDKTKWEVSVNSLGLKNIYTKGSLELTFCDGQWTLPANRVWTTEGSATDYNYDCSTLEVFKSTEPQTLWEDMFILPQSLDQGQKLSMNLSIKTWRDTGDGYPEEPFIKEMSIEMDASLSTESVIAWGMNHYIKYNLILAPSLSADGINPTEITFDPAEADWETLELNTIIKL